MAVYTTIDNPELYFQTVLYTGDGNNNRTITLPGSEDMQPDMIWIKERSSTSSHYLTSIGMGIGTRLEPDGTSAKATEGLSAVTSDGFTIGTSTNQVNQDTITHVAWCWKESADAGFDILTFEGNSTDDTDISHNLSAVPHWIICRNFDAAKDWCVYHHKNTSAPETDLLVLNTTAATTDTDDRWSDEAPTSSVFTVGDSSQLNASGNTSIAYLWSEKQGYSKFGSYTGNGNADGTFVYTGFRPAWIMIKNISSGSTNWHLYDNKRLGYNVDNDMQRPNLATADQTDDDLDILSNGFKLRRVTSALSTSGDTYIYMALAEQPFVNSKGVPCNAR